MWLKSAKTGGLSDVFCRYTFKNETYINNSNNKVKTIIGYDANSLYPSRLLDDLPWIEKIMNYEIFDFAEMDGEVEPEFKYL